MREDTKYDDINVLEKVILPMANLKISLEAILSKEQEIAIDDLLRGLRLVHKNASAILQELASNEVPEIPERRIPQILRLMATEQDAFHGQARTAIKSTCPV